jgi:flagellar hook-associated protein 2
MAGDLALTTGLMSGIDSAALVEAMTARQKVPIDNNSRKAHELTIQKEEYQAVHTALSGLEDSLLQLSLSATYNRKSTSFSTEGIATATATTAAEEGDYTLEVVKLAQKHRVASDKQASSTLGLGNAESTFKINGTSLTVSAGVSLNDVKDSINAISSQTNVNATILNDTLVFTAADEGQNYEMTMEDVDGNFLQSLGVITAPTNNSTNVEAGDIKGTLYQSDQNASFSAEEGWISIGTDTIRLNAGDSLQDVADKINAEGLTGISADVDNDSLRITSSNGAVAINDVVGNNLQSIGMRDQPISQLSAPDFLGTSIESSSSPAFTAAAGTLSIDGNNIVLAGGETLTQVRDLINAAGITDVSASIKDDKLRINKTGGEATLADAVGSNFETLGLTQTKTSNSIVPGDEIGTARYTGDLGAGFTVDTGTIDINGTIVNITAGMTLDEVATEINDANISGINAVIQNNSLKIAQDAGDPTIVVTGGTNPANLDFTSSSEFYTDSTTNTIDINGTSINLPQYATIYDIESAINAESATTKVTAATTGAGPVQISLSTTGDLNISDVTGTIATDLEFTNTFSQTKDSFVNSTSQTIDINGTDITIDAFSNLSDIVNYINAESATTGVGAALDSTTSPNQLRLLSNDAFSITDEGISTLAATLNFTTDTANTPKEYYNNSESVITINDEDVTIAEYSDLQDVVDAINTKTGDHGVTATLNAGQIELSSTGDLKVNDKTGSLAKVLEMVGTATFNNELSAAQDAEVKIDGLTVTSATNSMKDVISGVTVGFDKVGTTKLSVAYDTDYTKTQVENFIEKYNNTIEMVYDKLNFTKDFKLKGLTDEEKKDKSDEELEEHETNMRNQALSGDSMMQRIYGMLRRISFLQIEGVDSSMNSLADLGISTGSYGSDKDQTKVGKIKVTDETAFGDALKNNIDSIRKMFAIDDEQDESKKGLAFQLRASIQSFTSYTGTLTKKAGSPGASVSASLLDTQIAQLQLDILEKNKNLLSYQDSLLKKFENMETSLSQLNEQSAALAQGGGV